MRILTPYHACVATLVAFSMLVACDGGDSSSDSSSDPSSDRGSACPTTTLDCPCGAAGECGAGLTCVSTVCVEETLDWFTSSCDELGGTKTGAGACYFACGSNKDCGFGTECCNLPYQPYCRLGRGCGDPCPTNEDCGPVGWVCHQNACYLTCSADTAGVQSLDCPVGFSCSADHFDTHIRKCVTLPTSSGCGVDCPTGCCSPSGLSCCQPPFCAGDCVGSPCC